MLTVLLKTRCIDCRQYPKQKLLLILHYILQMHKTPTIERPWLSMSKSFTTPVEFTHCLTFTQAACLIRQLEKIRNQKQTNLAKVQQNILKDSQRGMRTRKSLGEMKGVKEFSYIGSVISTSGKTEEDIRAKIDKALTTFY